MVHHPFTWYALHISRTGVLRDRKGNVVQNPIGYGLKILKKYGLKDGLKSLIFENVFPITGKRILYRKFKLFEKRWETMENVLSKKIQKTKKKRLMVFDIGCGAGGVLFAFQQVNWQVAGVDFGEEYLEYGLRQGVEHLFKGTSEELVRFGKKANLIILSHVLEHFFDLRSEIGAMNQLLEPDGIVYIEMPGIKSLDTPYGGDLLRLLQNAHTYYFNLNTLENVMNSCGFELIYGNEVIESIFKIAHRETHLIGDMSSEYKFTVDYLKRIERRRRWGITKIRLLYISRIRLSLFKHLMCIKIWRCKSLY